MEKYNLTNNLSEIININNNMSKNDVVNTIRKEIINGSMNSLITNIIENEKKDLLMKEGDISYQITSSYNQNNNKYDNLSTILLGECENILKEK